MNLLLKFIISYFDVKGLYVTSIDFIDKYTIKIVCDDYFSDEPEYIKFDYDYDESIDKITVIWKYKELWYDEYQDKIDEEGTLNNEIKLIRELLNNLESDNYNFFIKIIEILDYLKKYDLVSGYRVKMPNDELILTLNRELGMEISDVNIAIIFLCYLNIYQVNNNNINEFDIYYSLNTYSDWWVSGFVTED